jgi:hypothetical protein
MPGCKAWLEDDALLLDLPEIGPVYLAHIADAGATAPAASLFTASGEVATINDLLDALSGPVPQPAPPEQAESLPPAPEAESLPPAPEAESLPAAIERVEDLPPSSAQSEADGPPARAVPLTIGLPAALAGAPDRVVLVVVHGLPEGRQPVGGHRERRWQLAACAPGSARTVAHAAAQLGIRPQRGDLGDCDRESRGRPDRRREHRHRALALRRGRP